MSYIDALEVLKLTNGDIEAAAELLAGPGIKRTSGQRSDDEGDYGGADQPALRRQRITDYDPRIKEFLEQRLNLPSDTAETEAQKIHQLYYQQEEEESKEEVMPPDPEIIDLTLGEEDRSLPNLNAWRAREVTRFKKYLPHKQMPNVVQHLPRAPHYGLLLTKNGAISQAETDQFRDIVMRQVRADRALSNNWENKTVEQLDDYGDPIVLFKGDVNSMGSNYGRVKPETRVTLNVGMDYIYSDIVNRGVAFDNTADVVQYAQRFIPVVDEFVRNTWPYANTPLPGSPNNILINYYSDRESYIGAHNDKVAPHMNPDTSPVVMISIGAQRRWNVIPQFSKVYEKKIEFDTVNGQIAIMYEPMQQYWKHALPKRSPVPYYDSTGKKVEDRISLTFRWLRPVPRDESPSEKQKRLQRMVRRPS